MKRTPKTKARIHPKAVPDELEPLRLRIAKGRAKYPNGCTLTSLQDEAGEVVHAVNKYEPAERVRDELLDVAGVAMRLYLGEIDRGLQIDGLVQVRTDGVSRSAIDVTCPTCGEPPGLVCRDEEGCPDAHGARDNAADRAQLVAAHGTSCACPTCDVAFCTPESDEPARGIKLPSWAQNGKTVLSEGEVCKIVAITAVLDHEDGTRSIGVPLDKLEPT